MKTANLYPTKSPEYFKLYEGKKDLEIESHFPEDYDKLTRRLATDEIFYQKYLRYNLRLNKARTGPRSAARLSAP